MPPTATTSRPTALTLIASERVRQQTAEARSAEHDDRYPPGTLSAAAAAYQLAAGPDTPCPENWPWEPHWWKPADRARNLVRAGALHLAEAAHAARAADPTRATMAQRSARQVADELDALLADQATRSACVPAVPNVQLTGPIPAIINPETVGRAG